MNNTIYRSGNTRTLSSTSSTDFQSAIPDCLQCISKVNDVVVDAINAIYDKLNLKEVRQALAGGILTCTQGMHAGGKIEINAIDFDNLASPFLSDIQLKARVEEEMGMLTSNYFDTLEEDTIKTFLGSAKTAAHGDEAFLSIHEIDDINFFTVVWP